MLVVMIYSYNGIVEIGKIRKGEVGKYPELI